MLHLVSVRGEGCDRCWSNKQQHRAIRTLCSHTRCIYSHTYTHMRRHSLVCTLLTHSRFQEIEFYLWPSESRYQYAGDGMFVFVFPTQERILLCLWHVAESDWMAHDQRQHQDLTYISERRRLIWKNYLINPSFCCDFSNVTKIVIMEISKSNCNLITHFLTVM